MKAGVPWLTVLYRPAAERVVPFAQWRPCAEYDQCQTYTRRMPGLNLECYRAVGRQEEGSVQRHGCRSLEARVAIRYFCLDLFCDELERASTRAFAALGSGNPSGGAGEEVISTPQRRDRTIQPELEPKRREQRAIQNLE